MKQAAKLALATTAVATVGAAVVLKSGLLKTGPVGNANVPEPAKPVDLARYAGRWYEFARYDNRFERGCDDVTADYTIRDDGKVDVVNASRSGAGGKRVRTATGRAKVVPGSHNARLKVSFFGPFYVGDYWVLDRADDYTWSIVGEPRGRYLWVLTRSARIDPGEAEALVGRVRALGYDTSLLRLTLHR